MLSKRALGCASRRVANMLDQRGKRAFYSMLTGHASNAICTGLGSSRLAAS